MLYVNPVQSGLLRQQGAAQSTADTRKAALQEFERLFLYQMIKEMRSTIPKSEFWGDNKQESLFQEMLDDHLAGEMAKSGKLGVADYMETQLKQQDTSPAPPQPDSTGLAVQKSALPLTLERHTGLSLENYTATAFPLAPLRPSGFPLK